MSFSTTLPYWYAQRGIPDAYTALSLSVYSFSATLGAFLGGTLSDRLGRKAVLVGTLSFGLPPLPGPPLPASGKPPLPPPSGP
jgi:MFS transporter, FSR family, fosmidomycin resistance protein